MKLHFLLFVILLTDLSLSQTKSPYRIFFTTQSARIDIITSPDAIAEQFNTYTVPIDLNNDGVTEEFVADQNNCGSGGCFWIIYKSKDKTVLGEVEGSIVYILKEKQNGFPLIETYWKLGRDQAIVHYYTFSGKEYRETKQSNLDSYQIDQYFKEKPPIADELKEIQ